MGAREATSSVTTNENKKKITKENKSVTKNIYPWTC
jgi:hypothetical protein